MDNTTAGLQPNPDKVMNGKNLIVVFCNVIFFIVVQTLFFKFIASKQFNVVLGDKVGIINDLAKHDPFTSKQINKYLKSKAAKELEKKAKVQSEMREIKNRELIKKWIGPPLAGALILLLLSYLRMKKSNQPNWSGVDNVLLSFVLAAYATEILFYIGIVRKFKFYGDQQIFSTIYKKIMRNYHDIRNEVSV